MGGNLTVKIASAATAVAGFVMLYAPPVLLGTGNGTVAFATALIVGGLAGLGVSVGLPAARASARAEGWVNGRKGL